MKSNYPYVEVFFDAEKSFGFYYDFKKNGMLFSPVIKYYSDPKKYDPSEIPVLAYGYKLPEWEDFVNYLILAVYPFDPPIVLSNEKKIFELFFMHIPDDPTFLGYVINPLIFFSLGGSFFRREDKEVLPYTFHEPETILTISENDEDHRTIISRLEKPLKIYDDYLRTLFDFLE
ncbi:MAG: hypothetical protein KM296_00485 [Brockia lithotrophica]|nr:hypothetical protein [Brockia lithotrophica]